MPSTTSTTSTTPSPPPFAEPVVVPLSDKERLSGQLTEEHVGLAVAALHRDGLVVLENAVDTGHMDVLNDILVRDAAEMAKLDTTHFNENSVDGRPTGNMSQPPPLDPALMFEDIWANVPAATVLSYVLGPRPRVHYVNGNTALGGYGTARQRVHADLFFNHAQLPFAVVANYYLADVSPANGSTELWLGSHRDTTFRDHRNCPPSEGGQSPSEGEGLDFGIRPECLDKRRAVAPPMQPTIRKGSVVLRDLRLWHAGLANPAADPRVMLAFVHMPAWYACPARVVLPEAARPLVDRWAARARFPVQYEAHFVPAQLDHRTVKFDPNFSSANPGYLAMLPPELGSGHVEDATKY